MRRTPVIATEIKYIKTPLGGGGLNEPPNVLSHDGTASRQGESHQASARDNPTPVSDSQDREQKSSTTHNQKSRSAQSRYKTPSDQNDEDNGPPQKRLNVQPNRLIDILAHKVEPQSKVYNQQQTLIMQHQQKNVIKQAQQVAPLAQFNTGSSALHQQPPAPHIASYTSVKAASAIRGKYNSPRSNLNMMDQRGQDPYKTFQGISQNASTLRKQSQQSSHGQGCGIYGGNTGTNDQGSLMHFKASVAGGTQAQGQGDGSPNRSPASRSPIYNAPQHTGPNDRRITPKSGQGLFVSGNNSKKLHKMLSKEQVEGHGVYIINQDLLEEDNDGSFSKVSSTVKAKRFTTGAQHQNSFVRTKSKQAGLQKSKSPRDTSNNSNVSQPRKSKQNPAQPKSPPKPFVKKMQSQVNVVIKTKKEIQQEGEQQVRAAQQTDSSEGAEGKQGDKASQKRQKYLQQTTSSFQFLKDSSGQKHHSSGNFGVLVSHQKIRHGKYPNGSHVNFQSSQVGGHPLGTQHSMKYFKRHNKLNNMSQNAASDENNDEDIIIANQVSNDSLLSKTDMLESAMTSKRNLQPKFNGSSHHQNQVTSPIHSVNPFIPFGTVQKGSSNGQSKTDILNQKKAQYRAHRRRKPRGVDGLSQSPSNQFGELDEATMHLHEKVYNSMASNDATMTLECIESREGGETLTRKDLHSNGNSHARLPLNTVQKNTDERDEMSPGTVSSHIPSPINPLRAVHEIYTHINALLPLELSDVQTTASMLKIKQSNEVHKNLKLKKGPVGIHQQSMSLFQSPSPKGKKGAVSQRQQLSPGCLNLDLTSADLPLMNQETNGQIQESQDSYDRQHTGGSTVPMEDRHTQELEDCKQTKLLRKPFDIRSQMISEITELVSRGSQSLQKSHFTNALNSSSDSRSVVSSFEGNIAALNLGGHRPIKTKVNSKDAGKDETPDEKPYIGPLALKPSSKKQVKRAVKTQVVYKVSGEEKHFKSKVQDCVKTMRVKKDKKQDMIKLLNADLKATLASRKLSHAVGSPSDAQARKIGQLSGHISPINASRIGKTITDHGKALKLTESRNLFAKDRKSLPVQNTSLRPILMQQGSPQMRFAPNQIKMEKFGGRFFTDNRRAFSLGVPVPPGPVPRKPQALLIGRTLTLHDQQHQFNTTVGAVSKGFATSATKSPRGRDRKRRIVARGTNETLPNINHQTMNTLGDFAHLGSQEDENDRELRGLSAFTKSQNMDIDTQTNFNIINYDESRHADHATSIECTCKQPTNKAVHFRDNLPKTSSQLRRDRNESQEWLNLAAEIVKKSESGGGSSVGEVHIPIQLLQQNQELANIEVDQDKIDQIKRALDDYQKLKELEEVATQQQAIDQHQKQQDAEYERARNKSKRNNHKAGGIHYLPKNSTSKSPSKKKLPGGQTSIVSLSQKPKLRSKLTSDHLLLQAGGNQGASHIRTLDEEADADYSTPSPQKELTQANKTFQIYRRFPPNPECPVHGNKEGGMSRFKQESRQTVPFSHNFDSSQIVEGEQQQLAYTSGPAKRVAVARQFNNTVSYAATGGKTEMMNVFQKAVQEAERGDDVASQQATTPYAYESAPYHTLSHQTSVNRAHESNSPTKRAFDALDRDRVGTNRIKMERINNVIEADFEKQNSVLERGLRNRVHGSLNKHIGTSLRNNTIASTKHSGKGGTAAAQGVPANGTNSLVNQQLIGHRQGQMLDRLKVIKNLAGSQQDPRQMKVLQDFISAELGSMAQGSEDKSKTVLPQMTTGTPNQPDSRETHIQTQYLPAIGLTQGGMPMTAHSGSLIDESILERDSARALLEQSMQQIQMLQKHHGEKSRESHYQQLDSEIQQFERRNKLLSGIHRQHANSVKVEESVTRLQERMHYAQANQQNNNNIHGNESSGGRNKSFEKSAVDDSSQFTGSQKFSEVYKSNSFRMKNMLNQSQKQQQQSIQKSSQLQDAKNSVALQLAQLKASQAPTKSIYSKVSTSPPVMADKSKTGKDGDDSPTGNRFQVQLPNQTNIFGRESEAASSVLTVKPQETGAAVNQ